MDANAKKGATPFLPGDDSILCSEIHTKRLVGFPLPVAGCSERVGREEEEQLHGTAIAATTYSLALETEEFLVQGSIVKSVAITCCLFPFRDAIGRGAKLPEEIAMVDGAFMDMDHTDPESQYPLSPWADSSSNQCSWKDVLFALNVDARGGE
jgi:hypothetical protein